MILKRLAAVAALAVTAALLAAPSATAGTDRSGPVRLSAKGGYVAPDGCQDGPPAYQLVVDEWAVDSYEDWSADITITGPGGYYETDFLWDEEGWNKLWFCESPNRAGTYTVTADVEIEHWSDWSYNYWTSYETLTTTFTVTGPARSKVGYAKQKYGAHGWKFPVRVTRAGSPWAGKAVTMQRKACGSWKNVATKRVNSGGWTTFYHGPKAGWNRGKTCGVKNTRLPWRFKVTGNWNTKGSTSTLFYVARR